MAPNTEMNVEVSALMTEEVAHTTVGRFGWDHPYSVEQTKVKPGRVPKPPKVTAGCVFEGCTSTVISKRPHGFLCESHESMVHRTPVWSALDAHACMAEAQKLMLEEPIDAEDII